MNKLVSIYEFVKEVTPVLCQSSFALPPVLPSPAEQATFALFVQSSVIDSSSIPSPSTQQLDIGTLEFILESNNNLSEVDQILQEWYPISNLPSSCLYHPLTPSLHLTDREYPSPTTPWPQKSDRSKNSLCSAPTSVISSECSPPTSLSPSMHDHPPHFHSSSSRRQRRDNTAIFQRAFFQLLQKNELTTKWRLFRRVHVCTVARAPCIKRYVLFCKSLGGEFMELLDKNEFSGQGSRTMCKCPDVW